MRLLAIAACILMAANAAADFVGTSWVHTVSHDGTSPSADGGSGAGIPFSSFSLADGDLSNTLSSTVNGSPISLQHLFSGATFGGEPPYGASTSQRFYFTVDAPTPFALAGSVSGTAGYGYFNWFLASLDENEGVIELLGSESLESDSDDPESVDPFSFQLALTGVFQPGFTYLFLTEAGLQSENGTLTGDVRLNAVTVPVPQSALLGVLGLAALAARRSLGR